MFSVQTRKPAPLYLVGELRCLLARDDPAALTPRKRRLCLVNGGQDFGTPTLLSFPKRQSFLHRVFFSGKTACLYGVADQRLLIIREVHFHAQSFL